MSMYHPERSTSIHIGRTYPVCIPTTATPPGEHGAILLRGLRRMRNQRTRPRRGIRIRTLPACQHASAPTGIHIGRTYLYNTLPERDHTPLAPSAQPATPPNTSTHCIVITTLILFTSV